jgi:hypothetical protein
MQLALHLQPAHSGFCAAVSHFCTLGAEERDAQTRTDTPDGDVEGVNADNFAYGIFFINGTHVLLGSTDFDKNWQVGSF